MADYVLATYGTGAVMAVPAHDERDFEFAKAFELPIKVVVSGGGVDAEAELEEAMTEYGVAVNSDEFDGMQTEACKAAVIEKLEGKGKGQKARPAPHAAAGRQHARPSTRATPRAASPCAAHPRPSAPGRGGRR